MKVADEARRRLTADLKRVGSGDGSAIRAVYEATSAKLFGVCLTILKDREAAEDALQDTYLKIWRRADRFDAERASPITWLCVIARNTSLDHRRALNRAPAGSDDALPLLADEKDPIDVVIEAEQERERIFACIDALDENQRDAIRSAFFDGLTYLELANRKDVPLGTMKSWIRRGLARLKSCVDDD